MPAPSLCVVSGVVYDENGVPAVGVTLYLKRVLLNGVLIGTAPIGTVSIPQLAGGDHTIQYIEAITSIAGGVVSFTVPQLSTVYLEGNVSGYNNGEVALSIPATATATLEALTPATFPIDVTTFTFLSLVDTPDDFTGDALKVVRVNAAGTALEFSAPVVVDNETVQDALSAFFPDVAPFDWTYDDAGDRVTLAILDATASARGLMSTAYATRLDQLEVGDAPTFAGLTFASASAIVDDSANEYLRFVKVASAINELTITNSAVGVSPSISATGGDTNLDILLTPKGTGLVRGLSSFVAPSGGAFYFFNTQYGFVNSAGIIVKTANVNRWEFKDTGHLLTSADNAYDIGALAATRPRTGYFGTSLIAGGAGGVGVIPLIAEGPAGQTANLFEARVNALPKLIVTAAGTVQVYNAFTDVSNYERATMGYASNVLQIGTAKAGTGVARSMTIGTNPAGNADAVLNLNGTQIDFYGTAGAKYWGMNSSGHLMAGTDNTYDIGASGATRPRNVYVAGNVTAPSFLGNYRVGSTGQFGYLFGASDGVFTLYNLAQSDFGRLQFGGTTSAFPSLKRSTTELQARLADDSGDATLKGKLKVHANAVAETPTATHTLRLFDAAGTEYKVLCIAA